MISIVASTYPTKRVNHHDPPSPAQHWANLELSFCAPSPWGLPLPYRVDIATASSSARMTEQDRRPDTEQRPRPSASTGPTSRPLSDRGSNPYARPYAPPDDIASGRLSGGNAAPARPRGTTQYPAAPPPSITDHADNIAVPIATHRDGPASPWISAKAHPRTVRRRGPSRSFNQPRRRVARGGGHETRQYEMGTSSPHQRGSCRADTPTLGSPRHDFFALACSPIGAHPPAAITTHTP